MKLWTLVLFLGFLSSSCVKKDGFLTPACSKGNSNCELPSMEIEIVGSDNSSQTQVGDNGDIGTVEIKSIRYGEKTLVEFILQNPKLLPLRDMVFGMDPGDDAFNVVSSQANKDCGDDNLLLLYKQKCSVTVEFKPSKAPPPIQSLSFVFKTLAGNPFTFKAKFNPATLMGDFYIEEDQLTVPDTAVLAEGITADTKMDVFIENTGTENSLTDIQFFINGSSEWKLSPSQKTPKCVEGDDLAARSGCYVQLEFAPRSPGPKLASLVLASSNQVSRIYPLTGVAKAITAESTKIDFGSARVGTPGPLQKKMKIRFPDVKGEDLAESCTFTPTNNPDFVVQANSCTTPFTLAQNSDCEVTIEWTPSVSAKAHNDDISWSCNHRGGIARVELTARSSSSPLVTDQLALNFENMLVGSSKSLPITFKNDGKSQSEGGLGTLIGLTQSIEGDGFTISSTTCTDKLIVGGECSASITLAPLKAGPQSGALNGVSAQTELDVKVGLWGEALEVTPSSFFVDFGTVAVKSDRPGEMVTIRNPSGTETATGCKLDYEGIVEKNFSLDSDSTCLTKTSLAPNETCSLKPRFNASLPEGKREASVKYTCSVGGSATVSLSGHVGSDLRLVVMPPQRHILSDRLVGTETIIEFLVMNGHATEKAPNVIVNPSLVNNGGWSFVSSNCPNNDGDLTAGSSCRVKLKSTPNSTQLGPYDGQLLVSANGGQIDPADGEYSSNNKRLTSDKEMGYNFRSVAINSSSISTPITIFNPSFTDWAGGATNCTLGIETSVGNTSSFAIDSSTCGASGLASRGSCRVSVKLTTGAAIEAVTGNLYYECPVGGRATIPLSAQTKDVDKFKWTSDNINFNNFGFLDINANPVERTFTFQNTDGSEVEITGVGFLGDATGFTIVGPATQKCEVGLKLAKDSTCQVKVRFDTETEKSYVTQLVVTTKPTGSNVAPTPAPLALYGAGSQMTLEVTPTSLTFQDQEANSSMEEVKTVTVTNNGTRPAELSLSNLSAPYSKTTGGTCGAELIEGKSCTLEIKMAAGNSPAGAYNTNFTITDSSSGSAIVRSVTLSGRILGEAALVIEDNVGNGEQKTIALSDVTGGLGNAKNIVDHSASKSVTYTITNKVSGGAPVTMGTPSLTFKSGEADSMAITQDSCSDEILEGNEECSVVVTYSPQIDNNETVYSLAIAGTSLSEANLPLAVTEIKGQSFKSATLVFNPASIDFGIVAKGTAAVSSEIIITNEGDYPATLTKFEISGESSSDFVWSDGTSEVCGSSLAKGSSCRKKITLTPTNILSYDNSGTLEYSYTVGQSAHSKSAFLGLSAVSYVRLQAWSGTFGESESGLEGEIAADASRVYIATRYFSASKFSWPVITVCERTNGFVDSNTNLCTQNTLKDQRSEDGWNFLAGGHNGSGPKISVTGNHIILAVNNEDPYYDDNFNDGLSRNANGNSTLIICKKPSADRIISLSEDCVVQPLSFVGDHSSSGLFPGLAVVGDKIALSNSIASVSAGGLKGLQVQVCSFDDMQSNVSTVLNLSSCKVQTKDIGDAERAQMGTLAFDGQRLILAFFDRIDLSLKALTCSTGLNDELLCGATQTVTAEKLGLEGDQVGPGAYPSIVIGEGRAFIAHQQGETKKRYLRLSTCALNEQETLSLGSCQTQTVAERAGASGLGFLPRISLVGQGVGAKLWFSFLGASQESAALNVYSAVKACTVQSESVDCSAPIHFDHSSKYYVNDAIFASRGHYIDPLKQLMIIPQATGALRRSGVVSLGLPTP